MAKAKKDDWLSEIKSFVMGYLAGVEKELVKRGMKYVTGIFFGTLGIIFLSLAAKDFLRIFVPSYAAYAIMGLVFILVAMNLKRR